MGDNDDPLGDGETVYATDPETDEGESDRDWPDHTDPEWLYHEYHSMGRSIGEMSTISDAHEFEIWGEMERHGIGTRESEKAISIGLGGDKLLWSEEWLKNKYEGEKWSMVKIAEDRGVSVSSVKRALDRFGITTRSRGESAKLKVDRKYEDRKYRDRDWLEHQYWSRLKSANEISKELGISDSTIHEWLDKHNIPKRTQSEACLLRDNDTTSELISEGDEREFVAENEDGKVVLDQSWQYFHERPAAKQE